MKKSKVELVVALGVALGSGAVQAANWSISTNGQYSKVSGALHETFDDVSVDSKDALNLAWTSSPRKPLFLSETNKVENCIKGNSVGNYMCMYGWAAKPITVVFDLSGMPADYYGFRWTTIDGVFNNGVRLYNGSDLILSATGKEVLAANGGVVRGYFEAFADAGKPITRVELFSSGRSFESDNHALRFTSPALSAPVAASVMVAQVPEASTYAMLLVGLGVIGLAAAGSRRRS